MIEAHVTARFSIDHLRIDNFAARRQLDVLVICCFYVFVDNR